MTYDELYRKVEGLWHDSYKSQPWTIVWDIVKLHKQYDFTWGNETLSHCECGEEWPCKTIEIIKKGLN